MSDGDQQQVGHIDVERWQHVQDQLSQVLRIPIRTVRPDGTQLTQTSGPARLCTETATSSHLALSRCGEGVPPQLLATPQPKCLPQGLVNNLSPSTQMSRFSCIFGLDLFTIPVENFQGSVVAFLLVGPVQLGRRSETTEHVGTAIEQGIDVDSLVDALRDIGLFSFSSMDAMLVLLRQVSRAMFQLEHQEHRLRQLLPQTGVDVVTEREREIDTLLNQLLDVATQATQAEIASVMVRDADTGDLSIRVSRGLSPEIVERTRVPVGEGISGLALQQQRSLLVANGEDDAYVRDRMQRSELHSAAVVPLRIEGAVEAMGVVSVATKQGQPPLTRDSLRLLQGLAGLAGIALRSA